jgi:hypothetical protein
MSTFILRDALAEVCKTSGKRIYTIDDSDKSPEWLVVSYKGDFDYLWHCEDFWNWVSGDGKRNILLVWDGMPEPDDSGVNVLDHITPVDWAMALSHRLLQNSKKDKNKAVPELRILICDISQKNHANAFAVRMLPAICHGMPWLRVYRPIESDKWFGHSFEDLVDDIKQFDLTYPSLKKAQPDLVESFVRTWIGSVAESGSHHDVSNLLGPLVLTSATGAMPTHSQVVTALWQITKWFHLHADGKDDGKGSSESAFSNMTKAIKEAIAIKEPVDFILIDDMADVGWADCVANLLGIDNVVRFDESPINHHGNKRLIKATTPYAFFPKLCDLCKSPDQIQIDSIMPLGSHGDTNGQVLAHIPLHADIADPSHQQVVLIDLRLFARSVSQEQEFLSACVRAALAMIREQSFVRRWSDERFTKERLGELQRKIDSTTDWEAFRRDEENCYLEVLSLFIRLLAQRYFTLPLVLFSSTGKRKVLEYLKPYGNVISAFDKPRIVGNAIEVEAALDGFREAIQSAAKLIRFRLDMQRLLMFTKKAPPLPRFSNGTSVPYVEVYFDETIHEDDKRFAVIAIVMLYESSEKAEQLDQELTTTYTEKKVKLRWGNAKDMLKKLRTVKDHQIADAVPAFIEIFKKYVLMDANNTLGIFGIEIQRPPGELSEWELDGVSRLDGILNQMLRYSTEAIIYELIPEILGSVNFSWRAFYANRHRPKSDKKIEMRDGERVETPAALFTEEEITPITKYWGIEEEKDQKGTGTGHLRTYGPASFRTMVEEIVSGRKGNGKESQPIWLGAVGVSINSLNSNWPRKIHGLADWFAFLAGQGKRNKLITLIPSQIKQKLDHLAVSALTSSRMMWHGRIGSALAECLMTPEIRIEVNSDQDSHSNHPLSRLFLKHVLVDATPVMKGEDVIEALRKIAEEAGSSDEAQHSTVEAVSVSLDGSSSDTKLVKPNDQLTEQGRGDVVEEVPLGDNELRIKFMNSVGGDGVSYAVLAQSDGIAYAVLSMETPQVAECKVGQIVVVKKMSSNRHAQVSHSGSKLSVLDFVGLGRSDI